MTGLPAKVELHEVGPRDGLQNIKSFIPTARKIEFIRDLVEAGCTNIEATSFVSKKAIPQLADAAEVMREVPRDRGVVYSATIPNVQGAEAAAKAGIHRVCVGTATTDEFQRANMNATIEQSLARIADIVEFLRGTEIRIAGYVSCITDCPYTGPVPPRRAAELAESLLELGCHELFLAETIGKGTAASISRVLDAVLPRIPADRFGIHLHDTYGQGVANLLICLERGITRIDSAVAGLGGCPFAPGAAGNIATEDVLYLLKGLGLAPEIDAKQLAAAGIRLCGEFGLAHASKAGRAWVS